MKRIESAKEPDRPELLHDVRSFWTRNVNAERIMGNTISSANRGDDQYFRDLEEQRYRSHYHILPWIEEMKANRSVLEIGCGIGMDSLQLAMHGLELTAIDLTHIGVSTAKKRFNSNDISGNFVNADAGHLPFLDNCFDYVYSFGVLHHAPNTEATIDEVYRVLKPGGEARIMLYNRHSLNELIHQITRIPFEEKHEICPVVRRFTKNETRRMFRRFTHLTQSFEYVFGEGYGKVYKYTPKFLYHFMSRTVGWHIMITAQK